MIFKCADRRLDEVVEFSSNERRTCSVLSSERLGFCLLSFLQIPKYAVDVNFSRILFIVFLSGADLDLNFARNSHLVYTIE